MSNRKKVMLTKDHPLTSRLAVYVCKAFLMQRTNECDTLNPFLFEKFFASSMCIRQID